MGLSTVEHKPVRSKAALKQRPPEDDEFTHLAPVGDNTGSGLGGVAPQQDHRSPDPPKPKMPLPKNDGSFQSSYLSFLQGNKQETLSSVTNSSITNKPELPKYIPEPPRPKPKPKPVAPLPTIKKDPPSGDIKLKPETVTFSDDDEESSQGSSSVMMINKTVQGVISNLGDDIKGGSKQAGARKPQLLPGNNSSKMAADKQRLLQQQQQQQQRKPLTLKIKMSDIKMPSDNSSGKPRSPSKKMRSPGVPGMVSPGGKGQVRSRRPGGGGGGGGKRRSEQDMEVRAIFFLSHFL